MVLPLILSFLGSGAAAAGALGGMSPLLAGAIGSGLGTTIETGDLEKGILSGLTGYAGGALLGGGLGGMGGANPATSTAALSGPMSTSPMPMLRPENLATNAASAAAPAAAAAPAGGGLFGGQGIGEMWRNLPAGTQPIKGAAYEGLGSIISPDNITKAGIGAALAPGVLGIGAPGLDTGGKKKDIPEADPLNREVRTAPASYRPGYDPEFNYFNSTNVYPSMMAEGGAVEPNQKDLVKLTIAAIRGEISEQQAAPVLGAFLREFGEDALRQLVRDVQEGRMPRQDKGEGMVRGPGDGMTDTVPAEMTDNGQDVLLSDGEFVVPADVVSGLGNGSSDAGSQQLYDMMDRVRQERTGKTEQPKQISGGGMLPA